MQKIRKITTISCIKIHTPYILGCSDAEGCEFDPRRVHQDTRKRSVQNSFACVFFYAKMPNFGRFSVSVQRKGACPENNKSGRTSAFIICCRFFRDTYRGAKACPRLSVPTWSPFFRSCNRGQWRFLRVAKTCRILRYRRDPLNR